MGVTAAAARSRAAAGSRCRSSRHRRSCAGTGSARTGHRRVGHRPSRRASAPPADDADAVAAAADQFPQRRQPAIRRGEDPAALAGGPEEPGDAVGGHAGERGDRASHHGRVLRLGAAAQHHARTPPDQAGQVRQPPLRDERVDDRGARAVHADQGELGMAVPALPAAATRGTEPQGQISAAGGLMRRRAGSRRPPRRRDRRRRRRRRRRRAARGALRPRGRRRAAPRDPALRARRRCARSPDRRP